MSLETSPNNGTSKPERKHYDRTKSDELQISRTDMNMLIMNYLVTEGFKEAALKFQQEAGLQEPALCRSLDERIMIREAVQGGRIPEAISMVNALYPELLDNDRYLYFYLQVRIICERMLNEQEALLRAEYETALNNKLSEQYESFVRFNIDQVQRRPPPSTCMPIGMDTEHHMHQDLVPSYLS